MKPLNIAIAGLGTVGCGLVELLAGNADVIAERTSRDIVITHVNARSKGKDRGVDLSGYEWVDAAVALADADVDVVVELIGGSEGVAYELVKAALNNKKHVVTANKALMAHHGAELAELAEKNNVVLAYEAAVAGGIPVIKNLREGLAGNNITGIYGILNGTCNYILSEMHKTGRDFEDVLSEAQEKGYAEADPTFDVDGIDAAHKLCLLSAIAFGLRPDFDSLEIIGIRGITADDIMFAHELGFHIKLLGMAQRLENGDIFQSLEPCLVAEDGLIGNVEGAWNAVMIKGDHVDESVMIGPGAGAGPTASSVVADIIDIARGIHVPPFNVVGDLLKEARWADSRSMNNHYYLRINVADKSGVLAKVTEILGEQNISVKQMVQHGQSEDEQAVPIMFTTHSANHGDMVEAVKRIKEQKFIMAEPCLMKVMDL